MRILTSPDRIAIIDEVCGRYARATAEYVVRLEKILGSLETLAVGAHGFDYAVEAPQHDLIRVDGLLSDLTFDIESKYGAIIRTHASARPERA
jgi:hypothetical protein